MKRKGFKQVLLAFCLILAAIHQVASGNGSTGVGNRVPIDGDIETEISSSQRISRQGNLILDGKTQEKLLRVDHIRKSELTKSAPNLVPSRMGQLSGFEYLPDQKNMATEDNYWVICSDKVEDCLRLVPLSRTNPRVLTVIGGLRKTN